MSAPIAIPAAVTAGQTPAGNAWAQGNAAPATGFEALLAALFPTPVAGMTGLAKGGLGLIKDGSQETRPGAEDAQAATGDVSAMQAQLASLLAVQPVQIQPTTATPTDATDTPKSSATAPILAATQAVPGQTPALTNETPKPEAAAVAQLASAAPEASTPPTAPVMPLAPKPTPAPAPPVAAAEPAVATPLVEPAAQPKAEPPPVQAVALLPVAEASAEPAPPAPAEPPPSVASAVAASTEAKPAVKTDKPEAPAPIRAAAASAAPASAIQAETTAAVQPPQPGADSGHDQPPPDQRETASSDKGAPDIVAAPTSGPASAAHMIQAEAAATAARGSPETVAKLAAQIVKKLDGKSSSFDIALDPIGLGKVDVKVEINAQGQMTAALNFDTAAAAAELRGRASELRAALEQAGFDMSQSNLSFSFAGQQENSGQAFAQRDGRRGGARFLQALADDQPLAAPVSTTSLLGSRTSGVDVRI